MFGAGHTLGNKSQDRCEPLVSWLKKSLFPNQAEIFHMFIRGLIQIGLSAPRMK